MDSSTGSGCPRHTPRPASSTPERNRRPRTPRTRGLTLSLALTLALGAIRGALGTETPPASAPSLDDAWWQGRFVYEQNCLPCHGQRGNGRGELATEMFPKPRDFTRGLFKYRSTPSGFLPTDGDLVRTIRSGFPGTAMPAFVHLPESDVRAVVLYLRSLSPRWRQPAFHAQPLPVTPAPDWLRRPTPPAHRIEAGARLFTQACAVCHGPEGAGDGPSAPELRDEWDVPCPPRDLRHPPFRAGTTPEDIHRTLMTGLGGTPMPSFLECTTEEQRWELVAFILGLQGNGGPPNNANSPPTP